MCQGSHTEDKSFVMMGHQYLVVIPGQSSISTNSITLSSIQKSKKNEWSIGLVQVILRDMLPVHLHKDTMFVILPDKCRGYLEASKPLGSWLPIIISRERSSVCTIDNGKIRCTKGAFQSETYFLMHGGDDTISWLPGKPYSRRCYGWKQSTILPTIDVSPGDSQKDPSTDLGSKFIKPVKHQFNVKGHTLFYGASSKEERSLIHLPDGRMYSPYRALWIKASRTFYNKLIVFLVQDEEEATFIQYDHESNKWRAYTKKTVIGNLDFDIITGRIAFS